MTLKINGLVVVQPALALGRIIGRRQLHVVKQDSALAEPKTAAQLKKLGVSATEKSRVLLAHAWRNKIRQARNTGDLPQHLVGNVDVGQRPVLDCQLTPTVQARFQGCPVPAAAGQLKAEIGRAVRGVGRPGQGDPEQLGQLNVRDLRGESEPGRAGSRIVTSRGNDRAAQRMDTEPLKPGYLV